LVAREEKATAAYFDGGGVGCSADMTQILALLPELLL
jgi:hypothetical protein